MKLLPWICVVGLLIGLGWVYSAGQKKEAELATLRAESQQLQQVRAELEETKNVRAQAEGDELARLRREHEELLRLRNEARQLRTEKQQLATQVQTAQAQVQGAQKQVQGAQEQIQALRNYAVAATTGQSNATARDGLAAAALEQIQTTACINNLRVLDGAKQQWALEKQKPRGALLTAADLAPYLRSNAVPTCPAGGIYTLNPVGLAPICNLPGHAVPK